MQRHYVGKTNKKLHRGTPHVLLICIAQGEMEKHKNKSDERIDMRGNRI